MGSELIAVLAGVVVISGAITGSSVYFTRKVAQNLQDNVEVLIDNLTEFIKKNEKHLSERINELDLDFGVKIDKIETRQQRIADYTEENRERIHQVKETVFHVRNTIGHDHPGRNEFEQVLEDIRVLKQNCK